MDKSRVKTLSASPELTKRLQERAKQREQNALDEEWVAIAEFGMYFGWDGVQAVLKDEITSAEMEVLLKSARKIVTRDVYKQAESTFIAMISANQKDAVSAFKQNTKSYLKELE
jgi:hypothetical protein